MILNERERRALAEIERHFAATDPGFARLMRCGRPSAGAWTRTGCAAVTVVASLSALLCVALSLIGPALVAVLLATAAHYLHMQLPLRTHHSPGRSR